jgi:ABC-type multidrug transport system fused ATPase/permease subunit
MERDPLRLAWRAAPLLHGIGFALIGLALPLAWIGLDLVCTVLDDAVAGRAFAGGPVAPFGRLAVALPERLAGPPLLLFPGVPLSRSGFAAASAIALGAGLVLAIVLACAFGRLRAGVAARSAASLRRSVLDGLARIRPGAGEDARSLAALAGGGYDRQAAFLGGALLLPAAAFGAVIFALLHPLTLDARFAAAVLLGIVLAAVAEPIRLRARDRAAEARREEAGALRRTLGDLVRRLPALHAHGTAAQERARVDGGLRRGSGPVRAADRRAAAAGSLALAAFLAGPAGVLGIAAWPGPDGGSSPGAVAAAVAAALVGNAAAVHLARWQNALDTVRPLFADLADALRDLPARPGGERAANLPGAGRLVAEGVAAYDGASGARLAPTNLSVSLPAHVALVDDGDGSARVLAGLLGGRLEPSSGRLTFGGVDLGLTDPQARSRRIAYAGGETVLLDATLRENLLYGCADAGSPAVAQRLAEAIATAGLEGLIRRRGLGGTVDPSRRPDLAGALVEARRAVRAALDAAGLADAVDPFDPDRYNEHATIGENILFGVPVGDALGDGNLPSHSFLRAILEAEGLTKALTEIGAAIAANMVEIFADVPDGHPLFQRFSFFTAGERGYFEHLVDRPDVPRRGAEAARDRDRLLGLALRYGESRHRLGLLDGELEGRLLAARAAFAKLLPPNLQRAIEFYRPDRYVAAASLSDNLLFGRIAGDRAGARAAVDGVVRRVLAERGLDGAVREVGLDAPLDPEEADLLPTETPAIDLARCLVRRPDVLVVESALDGLHGEAATELVGRLRRALIGRGLVLVASEFPAPMDRPPFDLVVRLARGGLTSVEDRRAPRFTPVGPASSASAAEPGTAASSGPLPS